MSEDKILVNGKLMAWTKDNGYATIELDPEIIERFKEELKEADFNDADRKVIIACLKSAFNSEQEKKEDLSKFTIYELIDKIQYHIDEIKKLQKP